MRSPPTSSACWQTSRCDLGAVSVGALLLVDLQEEYLARLGLVPTRETLITNVAVALAEARATGEPVLHIRTAGDPMPHRSAAPDATAPPELAEQPGEAVFTKRFFSAFDAPGLDAALKAAGITRLRLAGLHTHACLHATALDAYAKGYEVEIDEALIASDAPLLAAQSLAWLGARAAHVITQKAKAWHHRDSCNQDRILAEIPSTPDQEIVHTIVHTIDGRAAALRPLAERASRLAAWHEALAASRDRLVRALVDTIAKPIADAEAEVSYGLALLAHTIATASTDEPYDARSVTYRPVGRVGLITPWNNPFAIPLGKLAPAIAYGNTILWKPALPGTLVAQLLMESLEQAGLADSVALLTGGAATGRAMIEHGNLDLLSFTGSVAVGRAIIAAAGIQALPVQAELGGCNAAIVDSSADLDAAAADLATAMFSFSGQRCTAIRRVIVMADIAPALTQRLIAAVAALRLGHPSDPGTQIGPVIDRAAQQRFLQLAGATAPVDQPPEGCWVAPALLRKLPDHHPLLTDEIFGPLAAIQVAHDLTHALALHNATDFGLLGALYTAAPASEARFVAEAQAGMLSINRARPPFSAAGPFVGWKNSGFGPPEHGRWNRDTYARPQAIYRGD